MVKISSVSRLRKFSNIFGSKYPGKSGNYEWERGGTTNIENEDGKIYRHIDWGAVAA